MTSSHLLLSAILIHSSKLFSIFLISFFLNLSLTHSFTPAYLHHFHFLSLPTPPQPSSPSILAPHSFLKGDQTWLWNMCRRRAFPPRWDSSVVGRRRRGRAGEGILCYHSLSSSLLSFSLSLSLSRLRWCMTAKATCWPCDGLKHFVGKLLRAPQHTQV